MIRTQNHKYYLAASVSLITFVVYLSTLHHEFVEWDDATYVVENVHIRALNSAFFRWAFLDFYAGNWHPLTWISHALDYAVWGLNPLGHHLTNNVLHAVNTFLVVLLTASLMDLSKESAASNESSVFLHERTTLITAGVTGVLFGLHPLHVESVAWVAERKDLLCALFYVLGIIMYTNYVRGTDGKTFRAISLSGSCDTYYLLTLGFFILALLSKPMAISLPVVLLILDWYPFGRIGPWKTVQAAFIEKLAFFGLSFFSSIVTILAQQAGGAIASSEVVPFSTRILVAAKALIAYLGKITVPLHLIPFYPYPQDVSLFSIEYLPSIVLVIAITAACIFMISKQKLWAVAWSYYVVTLIPVIGLVQVGNQSMADRYMYLPSIGPFIVAGLAAAMLAGKITATHQNKLVKSFSTAAAVVLLVLISALTFRQIGVWKTSIDLWDFVVKKSTTEDPLAYNNRGMSYDQKGQYEKAIEDYSRAIAMRPTYHHAYNNRGTVYVEMGQYDKAIENFDRAITLMPSYYKSYYNRAVTNLIIGQFDSAIQDLDKAIALNQESHEAFNLRGTVYKKLGRFDKAIEDYDRAIGLNPAYSEAYFNRAVAYEKLGQLDKAVENYNQAIALNPAYYEVYHNLGVLYGQVGNLETAIEQFSKAILINQGFATAYLNRGTLFLRTGNRKLAMLDFQRACDLGIGKACIVLKEIQ